MPGAAELAIRTGSLFPTFRLLAKITPLFLVCTGCCLSAGTFVDHFDRPDSGFETEASISVGENYVLSDTTGATESVDTVMMPTARIDGGRVQFGACDSTGKGGPRNLILRYEGLALESEESGESFAVEGEWITHDDQTPNLLYGLAFNIQPDGSFYAARIRTGARDVMQLVRYDAHSGRQIAFGTVSNSIELSPATAYTIAIRSTAPGWVEYTLSGDGLDDGGTLSGSFEDTALALWGGFAGLLISHPVSSPMVNHFSIEVEP